MKLDMDKELQKAAEEYRSAWLTQIEDAPDYIPSENFPQKNPAITDTAPKTPQSPSTSVKLAAFAAFLLLCACFLSYAAQSGTADVAAKMNQTLEDFGVVYSYTAHLPMR